MGRAAAAGSWLAMILAVHVPAQEPAAQQEEQATVHGRVLSSETGSGLAAAKVTIAGRVRRGESRATLAVVETDPDGRFVAGPFPRAQIRRIVAAKPGYATVFEDLEVTQALDDLVLRLPAGVSAAGRIVRRGSAEPLAGITVATEFASATSEETGRFVLPGLSLDEPEVTLTVTGPGIAAREARVTLEGLMTEVGDLDVDLAHRVVIKVVSGDAESKGQPLAKARVRARLPTAPPYSGLERAGIVGTTDENGVAVLKGLPPEYPVVAEIELDGWIAAQGRLVSTEADAGDLARVHDIVPLTRGVALSFQVVSEEGSAIPSAEVLLEPLFEVRADFAALAPRRETEGAFRLADTDTEGRVRFERLPVQPLAATVRAKGFETQRCVVRPGVDAEFEVALVPDRDPPPSAWPFVSVGEALARASRERLPILFSFALDGERANDHFAAHHFRDPELVRFARLVPVVLANPFGVGGAPPAPGVEHGESDGRCTRYGSIPCAAHQEAWFWAADAYLPGARNMIAPFHVVAAPGGEELFRRPYYASEDDVANLIVRGLRQVNPERATEFAKRRLRGLLRALVKGGAEGAERAADDLALLALSGDETAVALFGALESSGATTATRRLVLSALYGSPTTRLGAGEASRSSRPGHPPRASELDTVALDEALAGITLAFPGTALRPFLDESNAGIEFDAEGLLYRVEDDPGVLGVQATRLLTASEGRLERVMDGLVVSEEAGRLVVHRSDEGERWRLVVALVERGLDPARIIGLAEGLRSAKGDARLDFLGALARSTHPTAAISFLVEAARAPGVDAVAGLVALKRLAPRLADPKPILPAALAAATSEEPLVREAAAELLAAVANDEALDALRPLVRDPEPTVRTAAAIGLSDGNATAGVPEVWDVLLAALEDPFLGPKAERALAARYAAVRPSGAWQWRQWLKASGLVPEGR